MDCTKSVNITNFDVANYKQYRKLADNGNADAQFELARFFYESGEHCSGEYRLKNAVEQAVLPQCTILQENMKIIVDAKKHWNITKWQPIMVTFLHNTKWG